MDKKDSSYFKNASKVLLIVLALNWLVAAIKIFVGLFSRCSSIKADGFHSLSDGTSNIIGLIGIYLATQPKDKEHPYGHKKYETFFSLGVVALLLLIAFELFEESLRKFTNPVIPQITVTSFTVMITTLAINCFVVYYEKNQGKALKSDILIADALHTGTDIFISLSVIVALIGIKFGLIFLDPALTMLIACFIVYAAFGIVKESSRILCDTIVIDEKKITEVVLNIEGVKNCHKIRTRGRSDDVHLDLHVQVNPDMHMDTAHELCYCIENTIKKSIPEITDVVVHMEPKD